MDSGFSAHQVLQRCAQTRLAVVVRIIVVKPIAVVTVVTVHAPRLTAHSNITAAGAVDRELVDIF